MDLARARLANYVQEWLQATLGSLALMRPAVHGWAAAEQDDLSAIA